MPTGSAPSTEVRPSRVLGWTFALLAGVYFLTANGRVSLSDSETMLQVSRALLEGRLDIPAGSTLAVGPDGRSYSHYGLLVSVWWLPFLWVGRLAAGLGPSIPVTQWEEASVSFSGLFIVLGLLGYLVWEWRRQGSSDRWSAAGVALFGLSTILWPYAKCSASDPIMALALLASYVHARRAAQAPGHWIAAGAWLGAAILARKAAQLFLPFLVVYYATLVPRGSRWPPALRFSAGLLPGLIVQWAYNWARWGHPLRELYGSDTTSSWFDFTPRTVLHQTWDLYFGEYAGFFVFNPALLILLIGGGARAWKGDWKMVGLGLALVASQTAFYGSYIFSHGRFTFGPRFLLPLIPFVALIWPLWAGLSRRAHIALGLAAAAGFGVQLLGVSTDPLAALCRRQFYLSPGTPILHAHYEELQRTLGRRPDPPPPTQDPLAEPYWNHPSFQEPDFWWWHMARWKQRNGPTPPRPNPR